MQSPLSEAEVTSLLANLGLPAPTAIRPSTVPGPTQDHALVVEGHASPLGLRVERHPLDTDPLSLEVAALAALGREGWPVAPRCQIVSVGHHRATLRAGLPGELGTGLLARDPSLAPALARSVGHWLGRLSLVRQPRPGWTAIGNRFVARRRTWKEQWEARVRGLALRVQHFGLDAPIVHHSLEALFDATEAMAQVVDVGLVHRDLHPGRLRVLQGDQGLEVVGIDGWHCAISGDPLLSWATPFVADDATVQAVLEGDADGHLAMLMMDPGADQRLDAYVRLRWMEDLVDTRAPWFRGAQTASATQRCLALQGLESCRTSPPHQRFKGVDGLPPVGPPQVERSDVLSMGLLQSLERGRVSPTWAWTWCSAVAAVELGEGMAAAAPWLGEADRLVHGLGEWVDPEPAEVVQPVDIEALTEHALVAACAPEGGHRLPAVFLAHALRLWGGDPKALPPVILGRLSQIIGQLDGLGPGWRGSVSPPAGARLAHALMGLAAVHQLSSVLDKDHVGVGSLRGECAAQAEKAWGELTSGAGSIADGADLDRLRAAPPRVGPDGTAVTTGALCAALLWLHDAGRIPVSAVDCARRLGLLPPPSA